MESIWQFFTISRQLNGSIKWNVLKTLVRLEIKVFKSLFKQIMDGLNFGHIYNNYVTIWICLTKCRRIFLKASISLATVSISRGFRGLTRGGWSVVANRVWIKISIMKWNEIIIIIIKNWHANKDKGGNTNITVLWGIMLFLSWHNQNPP